MNRIYDKIGILILCMAVELGFDFFPVSTAALLITVIFSVFCQCIENIRFTFAIEIIFSLLCFLHPAFCAMLPLVLYDMLWYKNKYAYVPILTAFIINIKYFLNIQLIVFAGAVVVCFFLQKHTAFLEKVSYILISERDSSEEINMLLKEKNRSLNESRDNEIIAATLRERNRIAREIHDNVGHMLSRTLIQIGALMIINKDEKVQSELESIKGSLNTAMTGIRESVHNLHDDSVNLKNAVADLSEILKEKFKVRLEMDFDENMPKNIKYCFIGIVKEGISNILRHSNGNTACITIREHPAFYQLMITDNGTGGSKPEKTGIGLFNMQERAESLGGIFKCYVDKNSFKIFVSVKKQESTI